MLIGTAELQPLADSAPHVAEFIGKEIRLHDVTCMQYIAEMPNSAREAALPPSLHPTIPAAVSVQVYDVGDSPWGAFRFANTRISCRSGARARGFSTATLVDGEQACAGLRTSLGFPARPADIAFRHGYDGVSIAIVNEHETVFALEAIDPEPMGLNDVQYTGTLNLAHTPMGLRLMQIEAHTEASQVDRLQGQLLEFDGAALGNPLLEPVYTVSASVAKISMSFPPVRFVCKADELAFTGTEAVG